jgi:surface antigen
MSLTLRGIAATALLALAAPALAGPPDHAPAHGRRAKDAAYRGYAGHEWQQDYGVRGGRCRTDAVLGTAGAAVGGIIGAQIGRDSSPEGRAVATIIGAAAGGLIGAQIGRDMDDADRACIGHSLELAPYGREVVWVHRNVRYVMVPVAAHGEGCRRFTLRADGRAPVPAIGCTRGDGRWDIRMDDDKRDRKERKEHKGHKDKDRDDDHRGHGRGRDKD